MRCPSLAVGRNLSCLLLLAVLSCAAPHAVRPPVQHGLRSALSAVEGTYTWEPASKRYLFSEKPKLEAILSTYKLEDAVPELVACLDDLTPSRSSLDGKAVATGVICYEALSQSVYYEPLTATGDPDPSWPGVLTPTATPEKLGAAKQAWAKVLAAKSFRIL